MKRRFVWLALLVALAAPSALACTGVAIANEGNVIVGGNEDWQRPDAYIWAEAVTDDAFGAVYFGYEIHGEFGPRAPFWFEFQGLNDQGLYFDTFGAPTLPNPNWAGKPACPEHVELLLMRTCATVEAALDLLGSYNLARYRHYNEFIFRSNMQFFLVDASGNAAIVDGETIHWIDGEFLVITNFRLSDPSLGGWPCPRYDQARYLLARDATPTLGRVAEILDATQYACSRGYPYCTRYSVVCDLVNAEGALYFNGDFTQPIGLDIRQLCLEGMERTPIEELATRHGTD